MAVMCREVTLLKCLFNFGSTIMVVVCQEVIALIFQKKEVIALEGLW
jgi:hypothetical protein